MNPEQSDASLAKVWSERELMKMLMALWRAGAVETLDAQAAGNAKRIKSRLLQVKMEAHSGCSPLEHDLWLALHEEELRISEQNGRRFEDSNFRRRIEALGIVNAAIENVLHFRTRASSRLKGVSLEAVLLRHKQVFGVHLCDVASKNLEMRMLCEEFGNEPDDE